MDNHLKAHTRSVHLKLKPFKCEMCEMTFAAKGDRDRHIYTHLAEKRHKCNLCSASFVHYSGLYRHFKLHKKKGAIRCKVCVCAMLFISENQLRAHNIMRHNADSKCVFCDKTFFDYGTLKKHLRIHTREKVYDCKGCNNSFLSYEQLLYHKCLQDK
ncbi:B-cell lymphoma 6 protein [Orchesella cincta]|uniref:B-cell lymphoma 6 protein n=1 Tax=Orchesella cincta TaxID=48709 RepID=A0A1D2MKE3_ORCCI|nr:B-cell lymphoma 6 protein [Orchesella cincta]